MSSNIALGVLFSMVLFGILIHRHSLWQYLLFKDRDNQSSPVFKGNSSTLSRNNCQRTKRSVQEEICPQNHRVTFDAFMYPGYKVEVFCDKIAKGRCISVCQERLTPFSEPRRKFLGAKMVNGVMKYYFKEMYNELFSAACICI